MQNPLAKRQLTSMLASAAMLYGAIFLVNWLAPKACQTEFWPPSIHCRGDLYLH